MIFESLSQLESGIPMKDSRQRLLGIVMKVCFCHFCCKFIYMYQNLVQKSKKQPISHIPNIKSLF